MISTPFPRIRITLGAQGILRSACHSDCNPLKAASHRLLGGTLSEAGAAIGDVAPRRIINHLSGPSYPNSYRYLPARPEHRIMTKKSTLSLIHISEPTRRTPISYAVF